MATVLDQGIVVRGFPELQKALERIGPKANFGVEYEVQRRLHNIGEHVAVASEGFITHGTGRHGDPALPRLEDTVRVSVTQRRSTVYSQSPYAAVQNFGGGPKAGWAARGPHIPRASASKWLNKAVASERTYVDSEYDGVLDFIEREWNAG
jgi:hypothetical protein